MSFTQISTTVAGKANMELRFLWINRLIQEFHSNFNGDSFRWFVSFAMSINKSQGKSLKHVGVYLSTSVFSHGQLYVAISRATSRKGLNIVLTDYDGEDINLTSNVVYRVVFSRSIYILQFWWFLDSISWNKIKTSCLLAPLKPNNTWCRNSLFSHLNTFSGDLPVEIWWGYCPVFAVFSSISHNFEDLSHESKLFWDISPALSSVTSTDFSSLRNVHILDLFW